jgi:NitT/TauT family transport system permease protein
MAATSLTRDAAEQAWLRPERRLQLATLVGLLAIWETIAASGLLYRGVVPSVTEIVASLTTMLGQASFWTNFLVTASEIGLAILIGGGLGLVVGLILGGNRFLSAAYSPFVIYLASTPKVILLPIIYLMFGIGPASKIVVGSIACFMPMAISVAAGMRQINPALIRVGWSFNLTRVQMIQKVYLPAMLAPVVNGLRIALGSAIVVCLVAEIKFSNMGIGQMVIDNFNRSRFAEVYAALIVITTLAVAGNSLVDRLARRPGSPSPH